MSDNEGIKHRRLHLLTACKVSVMDWNSPLNPTVLWTVSLQSRIRIEHFRIHIYYLLYIYITYIYARLLSHHMINSRRNCSILLSLLTAQRWRFPMQKCHNGPQLRMHNMYILSKLNAIMYALNCISARYAFTIACKKKLKYNSRDLACTIKWLTTELKK